MQTQMQTSEHLYCTGIRNSIYKVHVTHTNGSTFYMENDIYSKQACLSGHVKLFRILKHPNPKPRSGSCSAWI